MPDYRRWYAAGGTYFFTLVAANRVPLFQTDMARTALHAALADCAKTRPFELPAIVLLPDHLHVMWTLPANDFDFSTRLAFIKSNFTHAYLAGGGKEQSISRSRSARGNRGVWQRRFHEHLIRDQDDYNRHFDYVHYNPVKHGLVTCPHAWPHSSFHRAMEQGQYDRNWNCGCDGRVFTPTVFSWAGEGME